jgi:type I restriction enzyme, S subunit
MSWEQKTLGEVAEIVSGSTPKSGVPRYWDGAVAWATPTDLSRLDGKHLDKTDRTITEAGLNECSARLLPPGSVLFSSRAPIGLVAINTTPMATNQGFKSFVPRPEVNADYLYWWLRANRRQLEDLGNGATFKEVSKAVVSRVQFPLPPLTEQRRIAAILDKADAIRRKREQALTLADDFLRSVFLEMFGDPVANPLGFSQRSLGSCSRFMSGATPSKANPAFWVGEFPWVSPKDMKVDTIWDAEDHVSDLAFEQTNLKKIDAGTPLIVVRGMILVHTVPMAMTARDVAINQDMKAILFDREIDPLFGFWCLKVQHEHILGKVDTAAHGTKRLDTDRLGEVMITVPDDGEQQKFLTIVRKFNKSRDVMTASAAQSSNLFAALSQRAFAGGL